MTSYSKTGTVIYDKVNPMSKQTNALLDGRDWCLFENIYRIPNHMQSLLHHLRTESMFCKPTHRGHCLISCLWMHINDETYRYMSINKLRRQSLHTAVTSGVTRVGVTRGGNWWVSPYLFWKNSDDLFVLTSGKWWPFYSCCLLTHSHLPSSHVVYPMFFLNSKFSHKKK